MQQYEEKLKNYIADHKIRAEHVHFDQSCHSVAEAALAVKGDSSDFVKNICAVSAQGNMIVAIVKGEDKVDTKKVAQAANLEKVQIATPQQILDKTGFPCGGTPSFGFTATFLIDPRVMEKEKVWTGGGSDHALVKIDTFELQRANKGIVVVVRK